MGLTPLAQRAFLIAFGATLLVGGIASWYQFGRTIGVKDSELDNRPPFKGALVYGAVHKEGLVKCADTATRREAALLAGLMPYANIDDKWWSEQIGTQQIITVKANPSSVNPLNLNGANRNELIGLHGITASMAQWLITTRETHGPFRNMDDVRAGKFIPPKILESLEPVVVFGELNVR